MDSFAATNGRIVLDEMIRTIRENAGLLSEIDGAIGDGDHVINMSKGFTLCGERLAGRQFDLSEGLATLGSVLMTEIGGAMGPLYGSLFREMAKACKGQERVDGKLFAAMLERGTSAVAALGGAKVGGKTLLDVLAPASTAFQAALDAGVPFAEALADMSAAAEKAKESTRGMVACMGRSSRVGERSRGVLDAGASSCCLLLVAMTRSVSTLIS